MDPVVLFKAAVLGMVEGVTEFLPVSSTGHLLVTEHLLGSHQTEAFNVLIQVGPIIAVTLVFWKHIVNLVTGLHEPSIRDEAIKLCICFLLTGMAGIVAKRLGMKLPETVMPIAIATLLGAGIIFWAEHRAARMRLAEKVTWPVVFAVAAGQVVAAIFPGTSRSGAAVIAALLLGLTRPAAIRFAFLVGIPTMLAAGAFELKETVQGGRIGELLAPDAVVAFFVATGTAWCMVVWLIRFVQSRTFIPFAWYRIGMGLALLGLTWIKAIP